LVFLTINKNKWLTITSYLVFWLVSAFFISKTVNATTIKVVTEYYPPYSFLDKQGNVKGCSTMLVKALFALTGDELKIELMPWARAFYTAKNFKNTLIFSIARNKLREHNFYWIGKIKQEKYLFWGLKSKYPSGKVSTHDFDASTVAVAKYTTNDQMLTAMKKSKLHRVTEITQGINMLLSQRIDLIIETEVGMRKRFEKQGYDFSRIKAVYEMPELNYYLYIALNIDSEPQLAKRYQMAYQQLVKSGRYTRIIKQCDQ
jgi:polar amino acid transport system substrate-binding protein